MGISVKICGLKTQAAVDAAHDAGAAWVGFVLYPDSPRHLPPDQMAALRIPTSVKSVYVVVNQSADALLELYTIAQPDFLQLHGHETLEEVITIRKRIPSRCGIIKAITVRSGDDIARAHAYSPHVDALLFDAKPPVGGLPGGNGLAFDWALLAGRQFEVPWFLSGGLHTDNVEEAVRRSGALRVDASSSVESAPGVKDPLLIRQFCQTVQRIA